MSTNDEDSDSEERQLQNEHRAVKIKLLPLSTRTQQLHGCSSQSAVSIAMPTIPSEQSISKTPDCDFRNTSQNNNDGRHPAWSLMNLQRSFYRLFEPREALDSQRLVRSGDAKLGAKYCDNTIKTSRYSIFTFIPLNLFEQFLRTANIYFFILVCLQAITTISPVGPLPKAIALTIVISITAIRQGVDDFFRYRSDQRINNRTANLVVQGATLKRTPWRKIRVGQIVQLANNEPIPADMVLLSSSTGICYLETAELDGETNLKYRIAVAETQTMGNNLQQLSEFRGEIQCEPPNNHLTRFAGCLNWQGQIFALNNSHVLLRGCTLRNTDWAFGLVVYTGQQTKVMKNAGKTLYKRTRIEKLSNKYFLGLFAILMTLLLVSAIGGYLFESGVGQAFKDSYSLWMQIDGITPELIAAIQCLSYLILVQQIMPMIMYVTLEKVQLFLSRFLINGDAEMYHAQTDTRAQARTSTLNEDLGQIEYIFSDKTGTLTQNVMTFNKCSIAGKAYGKIEQVTEENPDKFRVDFSKHEPKYWEPSFKFYDKSLLDDVQRGLPEVDDFFLLIALCHTLNAEIDDSNKLTYKAQSPDESALVTAARNFGFVFKSRTRSTISVEIRGQEVTYQLLNTLEFDTSRKRMSVIVIDDKGRRRLLCKGADSAIFALLKEGQKTVADNTKVHLHEFACSGLRTLCCAAKDIDEAEWAVWNDRYQMAAKAVEGREERICECSIAIEKNLTLIGATAIEDKLQEGVPETIANLTNAGIKIWVLTGDKQETAVNIGQSCNMIRPTTEEIVIDAECYPGVEQQLRDGLERIQRRNRFEKAQKSPLLGLSRAESSRGLQMSISGRGKKNEFALVISGHSLFHALTEQLEELFLNVACSCQTVICCRVAPLQKGRVVELVRRRRHAMTLAIGDGGNDVNMIRTAHVGVGICGNEGTQAALSSDFTFAQFRFLQRLLLVHGRWNYLRMSTFFNFFFYKTLAFSLCPFWYGIYCGWSAQSLYDQWFITAFTLVYTSSPLLYFALFEQDVNEYYSQKFPKLYYPGLKGTYFNLARFILSKLEGLFTSLVAFFMLRFAFCEFNYIDGDPITTSRAAIGMALGTMLVIIVVVRCCMETTYWTLFNVWPACSIIAVILIQYLIAIVVTKTKKKEYEYYGIGFAVWTSPNFWLTCIASVAICCLPILFIRAVMHTFKPSLLYRVRLLQQKEGKKPTDYQMVAARDVSSDNILRRRSGGSSNQNDVPSPQCYRSNIL